MTLRPDTVPHCISLNPVRVSVSASSFPLYSFLLTFCLREGFPKSSLLSCTYGAGTMRTGKNGHFGVDSANKDAIGALGIELGQFYSGGKVLSQCRY